MRILSLRRSAVVVVNVPDERVLHLRVVLGPVAAHGNQLQRPRRRQRSELGVVRFQLLGLVDRHATFAMATAKEMRGHHHHRHTHRHALINRRQQKSLRAATGTTGHANALRIHVR